MILPSVLSWQKKSDWLWPCVNIEGLECCKINCHVVRIPKSTKSAHNPDPSCSYAPVFSHNASLSPEVLSIRDEIAVRNTSSFPQISTLFFARVIAV